MKPFVSPHTATWLSFQNWKWIEWISPLQIERILEFKFGFSFIGNKPTLQWPREEIEKFVAGFFLRRSCLLSYSTCALNFTLEISLSACVCVLTPCQCCVIYSVLSEGPGWQLVCPLSSSIMTKFIIPLSGKWHCCWQDEATYFAVSMSNEM